MRFFLKRVYKMIKPHLLLEVLGLLMTIVFTLSVFASPIVSKYLIDEIVPAHSEQKLYTGLILFFLICISQPVTGYFKDIIFLFTTEKITLSLREKLFSKVLNARIGFFEKTAKGEIISRILNDGSSASEFITMFFVSYIKNMVLILLIITGMLLLSVKITLIILGLVLLLLTSNLLYSRKIEVLSSEVYKNFDLMCTKVSQMADSIVTIKSFILENTMRESFRGLLKKNYSDSIRVSKLSILVNNTTGLMTVLSLCIIYGMGALSVMKGQMTLGTVIALGLYFQLLNDPVSSIVNNNMSIQKILPVFTRLDDYFSIQSEKNAGAGEKLASGDIHIQNICFSYPGHPEVLENINMHIKERSYLGIVGASGAGKSTLVKILMGFYRPTAGHIYIGETDIQNISIDSLRKIIGYVSQDIDLFNISIKENIRLGYPDAADDEIYEICMKLNIHKKVISLPESYESIITERINLSGGEKQRIAIARALIKRPSILVLDEPTSALDHENEAYVAAILKEISRICTVIVISHKDTILRNADKIFYLKNGKVLQNGL